MERYINLFTDFGFKKIFGSEVNKNLLIDFLNELLRGKEQIRTMTYLNTEHIGMSEVDRKAIFDLYCENESGEKFIIELQRVRQEFFKDRSIYYSSFAMQEQAMRGENWKYKLKGVYTIAILDFIFSDNADKFHWKVKLMDKETHDIFYNKLEFVYLEMPKFTKTEDELETHFDKWLFLIKNLHHLDRIPKKVQEGVFLQLFEQAEIAKYQPLERQAYQHSRKYYLDWVNSLETTYKEGIEEGFDQGAEQKAFEMAKKMLQFGESDDKIMAYTGLNQTQIQNLKHTL